MMFGRNEIGASARPAAYRRYPWQEMEEYLPDGGMWRTPRVDEVPRHVADSAALMARPSDFLEAMLRAVEEWPRSVSVAMTTPGMNRRAWMGHAGCFLATGSVEECTRLGWHTLDEEQQEAANAAADEAIAYWHSAQGVNQQGGLFDA